MGLCHPSDNTTITMSQSCVKLYECTKFGTNIVGEMCTHSVTWFCAYLCRNEDTMNDLYLMRFCCLMSMEVRRPIRDGDEWERGTEEWNLETGANPEDQGCRGPPPEPQRPQHHGNCCPICYAEQGHNVMTMSVAPLLGNNRSRRSPTLSIAQHHLPVLGLFFANFLLRVQLTSLLLISPGLSTQYRHKRDNLL